WDSVLWGCPGVNLADLLPLSGTQRILLRPAAAEPQAGPVTLFEDACAGRKMGFREKLPDPSVK
ncbi:unnamed protein product, partial [marine sediment metagenome]